MKDEVNNQRVVSTGGLNTLNNYLTLSTENPGAATQLLNFETSLSGGYRRINGYAKLDSLFPDVGGASSTGPVLFIGQFLNTSTGLVEVISCRKEVATDTYKFWKQTPAGWVAYVPGFTMNMAFGGFRVHRVRAEQFNFGDKNQIIFTDGVNGATVYDGTTWYRLLSTNAGGAGSPGGSQLLDHPKYVTLFKNTLFVAGDESFKAIVAYSAPKDALTWTSAAGGGQILPGFEVQQIRAFRNELYVFGQSKIKKIVVDTDFVLQDVTTNLGCVAPDSVLEVGGNLIFLSPDGIRPIAGTDNIGDVELNLISEQIQETLISNISTYDMIRLNGVVIRTKTQFRYFLSDDTDAISDSVGVLGSYRHYGQQNPTWEYASLQGISANVCSSDLINGKEIILHGGYDGIVYQQELDNSFDGRNITAIYKTPYLDMGDTEIRKLIRELVIFAKAEGSATLNVGMRFDWDSNDALYPVNYSADFTGGAIYGVAVYGTDVYATGNRPLVFRLPVQGSGYSVQYSFSTTGTEFPYTIHGFTQEFTAEGRQ